MVFYSQSKKIWEKIKKADNILINVHHFPDLDSVGCATAFYQVLDLMGKKAAIVCPDRIEPEFKFLKNAEKIKTVDFASFNFAPFDLFLILDTSSFERVTGSKKIALPESIETVVIDHHQTNNFKFPIRIVDPTASATAEIVYQIFNDWKIKITKEIATALFAGIAGDTVFFKYPKNPTTTFAIVNTLIQKGADEKKLVEQFVDNNDFAAVKLFGLILSKMKIKKTKNYRFVWSAVPYRIFRRYGSPPGVREAAADSFFRSIKNTDFGVVIVESKKNELSVSLRSKNNVDVAMIAKKLGGGGHKNAAGITLNARFSQGVKKIIDFLTAI